MADNYLQIAQEQLQKGIALTKAAHYQESIGLLERAAFVFKKYEKWKLYIETLNEIGSNYNELDNASKSIESLKLALQVAEKKGLLNHPHLILTFNKLGEAYGLQGEYDAELVAYENAFSIALKAIEKEALGLTYTNLGAYFNERGDYAKAIGFHQKALRNYLESDAECEDDIAICYNNLGGCYCNLGDYEQALPHFQKTLHSWLQSLRPNHPNLIYAYNNIASCYYFKKEFETAIPYFQKSLKVVEENFGVNHGLIAAISINVGNCYNRIRQFKKALQFYHQTTKVHKQLYAKNEKQPRVVFENYISLGNCYVEQNKFETAFDYFEQALKGYQTIFGKKNPKLADVLKEMGYAHFLQKNETEAIEYFQRSLNALLPDFQSKDIYQYPKVSGTSFSKPLLFALNRKSLSFYRLYQKNQNPKDLQAAFDGYVTLIQFIDAKRQDFKAYDSKLNLGEQLVGIYEKAIEVAVLMAKKEKESDSTFSLQSLQTAFNFAEKSKAVLLLADLKGAEAMSNIPQRMQEEEEVLKKELLELEKKIQEGKSKESSKEVLQLENEHFEVQQKYLQLIDQFERDYPDYHQLKYNTNTASVEALQDYLKTVEVSEVQGMKGKTIVLSYYVGKEFVFIFCITARDFQVHQIPKTERLEELVNDFLDAINGVDIDDFVEVAEELNALLLQPLKLKEYLVEDNKMPKIIVLRHGILNYLPFDALLLLDEKGDLADDFTELPYLVRSFEISYHYSATLLLHQVAKKAQNTFLEDSFLGIAPVSFNGEQRTDLALVSRGGKTQVLRSNRAGEEALDNLPNTENEVKEVFELFQSRELEAKIFLYGSASKQNLFLEAPKYKYILISTHGLTNEDNAKLSGIYLAKMQGEDSDSIAENDYLLYTSETYHLRLQADLVILSSCSSGIGRLYSAEGMMALHRGFLYAGANNIIFTQFDIPDESSSALVKKLFAYILEGNQYAAALQKAKMDLLVEDAYTPQDWAGFLLIGT